MGPEDRAAATGTPCRVLHVVSTLNRGGLESWLATLVRVCNRNVLQMDFLVRTQQKGAYEDELLATGSRIFHVPNKPIWSLQSRMRRFLRQNGYDVVHSHVWFFSGLVLRAAHRQGVPIRIAHSHTAFRDPSRSPYRRLYGAAMRRMIDRHATHCLGCSSEAAAALFGSDWKSNPKCGVLYCCIQDDAFAPGQPETVSKASLGIPPNAVVVGNVGNLREPKNHVFFLDIAAEFAKLEPRAIFFVAGEGHLRPILEKKAADLGIANRVRFAGARTDVPELLMHVFDAFLFPSLYEGMPLGLVEAAAAGLRTVCSDTITPEATDVLPEAFTRLSLTLPAYRWASALLESQRKGRIPTAEAYDRVRRSHFSVEVCLRELCQIYGLSRR